MNTPALVRTSVPKPEVVWHPDAGVAEGGRWQFCYSAEDGSLEKPFAEMEAHGGGFQIQRLGWPSGPCALDDGKILVSGMVNQ